MVDVPASHAFFVTFNINEKQAKLRLIKGVVRRGEWAEHRSAGGEGREKERDHGQEIGQSKVNPVKFFNFTLAAECGLPSD